MNLPVNIILRVKLRLATLWSAIRALKEQSRKSHDDARLEQGRIRDEKRAEADFLERQAEEIRQAMAKSLEEKNKPPEEKSGE